MSVTKFDKSAKYKACLADYIAKDGGIDRDERTALEDEHDHMVERVLAEYQL